MNSIRELIIPTRLEAFFWFVAGLIVLLVTNIMKIWRYLSGMSEVTLRDQSSLLGAVNRWLLEQESHLDPRIIDFIVWMFIGVLAVGSVMLIQGWLQAAGKELTLLEYMKSPSGRLHELHAVVLRLGLRVFGAIGLLVSIWIYLGILAPELDRLFFTSIVNLADWQAWLWLFVAPALTGFCLYTMTIFARLIMLRTQNF